MQSEFNKGASFARDLIICHIIGMQNKMGNDKTDKSYQTLQELIDFIENEYDEYASDFKG
jgi:hypothetical protein